MSNDVFGVCHCFNLRRAANKVSAMYNEKLSVSGLNGSQFSLLSYIKNNEPINTCNLSKLLFLDRTTLVRNLKPLESSCYIQYEKGVGRERLISLSEKGNAKLKEAQALWAEAQSELETKLGAEQMEMFHDLIGAIYKM